MPNLNTIEYVIVCYGQQLGYHHGAKLQILTAYKKWYSDPRSKICVVTDRPDLFTKYPCRILPLTDANKLNWSLNGLQHFGIKLMAFHWAMSTSKQDVCFLVDTDMLWRRDPRELLNHVGADKSIMYKKEGLIFNSKNLSSKRFEEGLSGKAFRLSWCKYSLTAASEMWASNIIGLTQYNYNLIEKAHELFENLEPDVDAHTVEQFSVSETLRLHRHEKYEARNWFSNWSSSGRKNYVTPVLKSFFAKYGEHDFDSHLAMHSNLQVKRPLRIMLKQKLKIGRQVNAK